MSADKQEKYMLKYTINDEGCNLGNTLPQVTDMLKKFAILCYMAGMVESKKALCFFLKFYRTTGNRL